MNERMPELDEKPTVPVQWPHRDSGHTRNVISERIARLAFIEYERHYSGQSFEQLHARGGFGAGEIITQLAATVERLQKELAIAKSTKRPVVFRQKPQILK